LTATDHAKEARRFELEWHKKPALGAMCLALALAGAAIAAAFRRTLWRSVGAFAVASGVYLSLRFGEQAADSGYLAPALAMWGPVLMTTACALAALRVARRRENPTALNG